MPTVDATERFAIFFREKQPQQEGDVEMSEQPKEEEGRQ